MAYTKTNWQDRQVQYPNRYTKSGDSPTEVTLTPSPGAVTAEGTPISAANMNKIEQGIADVDAAVEGMDASVGNLQSALDAHESNSANPHNVTKTQIGLGNVQDYGVASQAQAQAGAVNAAYMTPLRTKEYVDQRLINDLRLRANDGRVEYWNGTEWISVGGDPTLSNHFGDFGFFPFIGNSDDVTISANTTWDDAIGYRRVKKLTINAGATLRINRSPFVIFAEEIAFGSTTSTIDISGPNGSTLPLSVPGTPSNFGYDDRFNRGGILSRFDGGTSATYRLATGGAGGGFLIIVAKKISGTAGRILANGGNGHTPTQPFSLTSSSISLGEHLFGTNSIGTSTSERSTTLGSINFVMTTSSNNSITFSRHLFSILGECSGNYGLCGAGGSTLIGSGEASIPVTAVYQPTTEELLKLFKIGAKGGGGGRAQSDATSHAGAGGGGGAVLVFARDVAVSPTMQANGGTAALIGSGKASSGGTGLTRIVRV